MQFEQWLSLLSAGAAVLSAAVAVIAAAIAFWQAKKAKTSLEVETLVKLVERFESAGYEEKRKIAAKSCLTNIESRKPDGDAVEDILDFFEDVAFFVHTGALTPQAAWHGFYHWIRGYYQASEAFITERRKSEPTVYEELYSLYPELKALERQKHPTIYKEQLKNDELSTFLNEELGE